MTAKKKFQLEFGRRLRKARLARGLSQPELARLTDKSKQQISAWELGASMIGAFDVVLLGRLLACNSAWLLTGDGLSAKAVKPVKR